VDFWGGGYFWANGEEVDSGEFGVGDLADFLFSSVGAVGVDPGY